MRLNIYRFLMSTLCVLFSNILMAYDVGDYHVLLESNENQTGGSEAFLISYNSLPGFLNNSISGTGFSQLDIGASFSSGGFAFDGSQYHLLLESDENQPGGSEVFLISYNSLPGFFNNSISSSGFSQLDIGANFSSGGFAYDGSQYHLLMESDENQPGGSEVFLVSYNSLQDFVGNNISSSRFSQLDIGANFSAGGFSYDGSQFHVLLESDENQPGGSEVFLASYDSLQGFIDNSISSTGFSQLDIGANFNAGGFISETRSVPEPSALFVSLMLGVTIYSRRNRRT